MKRILLLFALILSSLPPSARAGDMISFVVPKLRTGQPTPAVTPADEATEATDGTPTPAQPLAAAHAIGRGEAAVKAQQRDERLQHRPVGWFATLAGDEHPQSACGDMAWGRQQLIAT